MQHVTDPDPDLLLQATGLTKTFGDFTAVDGIDFAVQRGEAFGFLGPNGAGKSSTMKMVGCVSPATGGRLRVFGQDPATHGPQIRARLGVVPQKDTLDEELRSRRTSGSMAVTSDSPARRSANVRRNCSTSPSSRTGPRPRSSRSRVA